MIVTKKDLTNKLMICRVCNNRLNIGDKYEKISTSRNNELVVHTNCIKKGCE